MMKSCTKNLWISAAVLGAALQAQAVITVSNQYLLDDAAFSVNPGVPDSTVPDTEEMWRHKVRIPAEDSSVQIFSTVAASSTANNDSFSTPVDIFSNGAADFPYYDINKTTLTDIYPDFETDNILYALNAGAVFTNLFSLSANPAALQDFQAGYVITLDAAGGPYTGLSDVVNLVDGTATNQEHALQIIVDGWNTLTWDMDPFSGGSIDYTDITSVAVEFFVNTVATNASGNIWVNLDEVPIRYTAEIDAVDTTPPVAPGRRRSQPS